MLLAANFIKVEFINHLQNVIIALNTNFYFLTYEIAL
jgi:hypothetical protein